MVGKGRPYIGERIEVRCPADVLAALDRLAARDGITRAELLRRLADAHVKENET